MTHLLFLTDDLTITKVHYNSLKTIIHLLGQFCESPEPGFRGDQSTKCMELSLHVIIADDVLVTLLLQQPGQSSVDQLLFVLSKQPLQENVML